MNKFSHIEGDIHFAGSIVGGRECSRCFRSSIEHRPLCLHHVNTIFRSLIAYLLTDILQIAVCTESPVAMSCSHLGHRFQIAHIGCTSRIEESFQLIVGTRLISAIKAGPFGGFWNQDLRRKLTALHALIKFLDKVGYI